MTTLTWRGRHDRRTRKGRGATRPSCEALEARRLLTTRAWIGTAGSNLFSTPGDWSPNGTPASGDTLQFSSNSAFKTANNDLNADTPLSLAFGTSGYVLAGNEVSVAGTSAVSAINPTGLNEIQLPILLGADSTFNVSGPASLQVDSLNGNASTTLSKAGSGTLILAGSNTFAGLTSVDGGTLRNDSTLGNIRLNGGALQGTGTVGMIAATAAGGTVAPGDSPGTLNSGPVLLNNFSTFAVELDGPSVGTEYDQLNVTGSVALGGAGLAISLGYSPGVNDTFTIVNNDGTDPVSGTFAGLPQGATVNATAPDGSTVQLVVSYAGGDGNDVVLSVNAPPVAADDFYSTPDNASLIVPAPGVLANDTDPNPADVPNLHPVLVTGPVHGTLSLSGDGSFQYDPAPGYSGADSFTYRASDGKLTSNLATVNLVVNAVNLPPVANADSYSAQENAPLTIPAKGVLSNDYSPEGLALTAELQASPQDGTLGLNADGSFLYTPSPGFVGSDQFTYRARDANGLASPAVTVTLNVGVTNVAPVASDDLFTLTENKSLFVVGPGVLANDTDANKDSLTSFLVTAPLHGSLTLSGDGSINYTPDPNYFGADGFTYRASDGQLTSNLAAVALVILPVNQPPVAANDDYSATEDQALTIAAPGVLANDTDPEFGTVAAVLVNGPQHGTLVLNPDGSFTYTPSLHYSGSDAFTYRASDGSLTSDIATVNLAIAHVNHAPVAVDDAFTTDGGSALGVAAPGVLFNDSDVDSGDILSSVLMSGPTHGTLQLSGDGSFVYTPSPGFGGADGFSYVATDGKLPSNLASVTITVLSAPVAPVTSADAFTGQENQPLSIAAPGLLLNDQNPSGGALSLVVLNGPQHAASFTTNSDGSFSYTPAANFHGTDSFTYFLRSGSLTSNASTVTLTTQPVTIPPVAVADAFTLNENTTLQVAASGVLQNDSDPNGYPMSAVLQSGPSHGYLTLNADGSFAYIPFANSSGPDAFTYRVNDGTALGNVATVSLDVLFVNLPPTATDDLYVTPQDARLVVPAPGILGDDSDPEGAALSAVLVNPTLSGVLALSANGGFTYTPDQGFNGTDSFTYRASDGSLSSNLATVTISVSASATTPTTVRLDPASDSGYSSADRITNVTTPTFLGHALPNLPVVLYATPSGSSTPTPVGTTTADASGNFAVASYRLDDGRFEFSVQSFRADGLGTGVVDAGPLTIDTAAPVITGVTIIPKTGQVQVSYLDLVGGMAGPSDTDLSNYVFTRRTTTTPRANLITAASILPTPGAAGIQTVLLRVSNGKRIAHGYYLFRILSGGVADAAGNALSGTFTGSYPTGNGSPGDYSALVLNGGFKNSSPIPTSHFIPVVTARSVAKPGGPAGMFAVRGREFAVRSSRFAVSRRG